MPALYILLGLASLLCILLLIPVRFRLEFEQRVAASLSYLFFKIQILPRKQAKPAQGKTKAEEEQNLFLRTAREEGMSSALGLAAQMIRSAAETSRFLIRRMAVERLDLEITVATPDAAQTALEYGGVCAAVLPLRGFLGEMMPFFQERVVILPDFSGENSRVNLQLCVRLRLIFAVAAAIRALCTFSAYKRNNRKAGNRSGRKDGVKA